MNTCAHCSAPLADRRLTSRALEAAFCSWDCYEGAWVMKDVREQDEGGWQVEAASNPMPVHAGKEGAGPIEIEGIAG